jgi:Uma2 family endonuclease
LIDAATNQVIPSSGNVFADMGLRDAAELQTKARLWAALSLNAHCPQHIQAEVGVVLGMNPVNAILEIPILPVRTLVLDPPLSDEEFERLSERTDLALVERRSDGTIQISELAGALGSSANGDICYQLSTWAKASQTGRVLMHCGFFLPDGSCLSAGSTFVATGQLAGLTRDDRACFLRFAPAFVIELRSPDDSLAMKAQKMETWIANGAQLGWLVDPYAKQVHIYESSTAPRVETGSSVAGSGPIEGFILDLEEVWRCYE